MGYTNGEIINLQSENDSFVLKLNYYETYSPYNNEYIVGEGPDHLAFKVENLEKVLEEARSLEHSTILELLYYFL